MPEPPREDDPIQDLLDAGWACVAEADHAGARRAARQILEREPEHPEAFMLLGLAELGEGDRGAALAAFDRASTLDPTYLAPILYSAEALAVDPDRRQEAIAKAEAAYGLAEPHTPEHVDVVLLHVGLLRGADEVREARRRLLRLDPGDLGEPDQRVHAARLALDLDAVPRAADLLGPLVERADASADVLHVLAQVAEREGDIERALALYLRVLARDRAGLADRRLPSTTQVNGQVRRAIASLDPRRRGVVAEAEIRVRDLPPEELVTDGLDPRLPLLLTGPPVPCAALEGRPRAYHIFAYRANLEPGYALCASVEVLLEKSLSAAVAQFEI